MKSLQVQLEIRRCRKKVNYSFESLWRWQLYAIYIFFSGLSSLCRSWIWFYVTLVDKMQRFFLAAFFVSFESCKPLARCSDSNKTMYTFYLCFFSLSTFCGFNFIFAFSSVTAHFSLCTNCSFLSFRSIGFFSAPGSLINGATDRHTHSHIRNSTRNR